MTSPERPTPANLKELFSFRLNLLAHLSSKIAALVNEREFELDSREWRIIGLLGAFSPFSLQALAREVNVDKSQASRIVSGLIQRGLLQRGADENDGRGVQLSLTPQGKTVYRKVFPKAVKRNEVLLSVLSEQDHECLERILTHLTDRASELFTEARLKALKK
ncbi:MarR family winged helix-turn-helix transcriptional regulator (plasmid) [Polaromonas sp. P1-6]|nr:MarR family winged helix-turn-helix transcriptional regulator [Polaromonas sp. P1-6]